MEFGFKILLHAVRKCLALFSGPWLLEVAHLDRNGDGHGWDFPKWPSFLEVITIHENKNGQDGDGGFFCEESKTGLEGVDGSIFFASSCAFGKKEELALMGESVLSGSHHGEAGVIGQEADKTRATFEDGVIEYLSFHDAADAREASEQKRGVPEGWMVTGND